MYEPISKQSNCTRYAGLNIDPLIHIYINVE